jgi:GGDEF domain-containing protein
MELTETGTLVRLAQRRFGSFSEAADSVLDAIAEVTPGVVALGRFEPDERVHRVIEARGDAVSGLSRGANLPTVGEELDTDFLRSLGAQAWISTPLEMSDGRIAGVLCAADATRPDAYSSAHAAQLTVAARLLSHEWESVELRSELRRLRRRVNAGPSMDPDTGIPNGERFLELLDHEWQLTQRGTVQSILVVCRVGCGTSGNGDRGADAASRLALKVVAEVLEGSARVTDRVGRIGEMTVGAILVGCPLPEAPAFVARFLGALERVTVGRQPEIEISCGVQPLAGVSSPSEVLGLAEAAAGDLAQRAPEVTAQVGLE